MNPDISKSETEEDTSVLSIRRIGVSTTAYAPDICPEQVLKSPVIFRQCTSSTSHLIYLASLNGYRYTPTGSTAWAWIMYHVLANRHPTYLSSLSAAFPSICKVQDKYDALGERS